jgi:crotonobetainyl-CoA:carnitine CoA-transferase CaiB-like acyl-CoA transferase
MTELPAAPTEAPLPMPLPLAGIRVIDAASYIAAPCAATVLADYGADVIKVEPPGAGDPNRGMHRVIAYPAHEVNYPWHLDSRGKRSLAIDLKNETARAALDRLIATADVMIVNYPPKVRARLRLDYERVAAVNPRLIYASMTGYGETGPDADQAGFDVNAYFARSGILDVARYDDTLPAVVAPAQGDRPAGIALAMGIMLALWNREKTGSGTMVASSLLGNGVWANANFVQGALIGAAMPKRPPPDRPRSAVSNVYRTSDERWLQLTIVDEERHFPVLCRTIGCEHAIAEPRFATREARRAHSAALAAILAEAFATRTLAEWQELLKGCGLPFAAINRAVDVADDAQAHAAGIFAETAIPEMPTTIAPPFTLADVTLPPARPAPELGEHSREVLAEAGLDESEIAALAASGAIA